MIRSVVRFVSLTMVLTMLLCAVGCAQPTPVESTPTVNPDPPYQLTDPNKGPSDPTRFTEPSKAPSEPTRFTEPVQSFAALEINQLRMPGYDKGWIARFHMVFGQEYKEVSDLDALRDALDKLGIKEDLSGTYDARFFASSRLILIPMQSGSGSVRYRAEATTDYGEIEISIGTLPMEVGTADMADWLLLIPLSRAQYSEKLPIVVDLPPKANRNDDVPTYDK